MFLDYEGKKEVCVLSIDICFLI